MKVSEIEGKERIREYSDPLLILLSKLLDSDLTFAWEAHTHMHDYKRGVKLDSQLCKLKTLFELTPELICHQVSRTE